MIYILTAVNVVGWLVIQLGLAAAATGMKSSYFASDNWYYRVRGWENSFYRRWLRIRRWKRLLPDGAPWVGGKFSKKTLERRDPAYMRQFAIETRRGEATHWLAFACFPLFFLWNPHWAWVVMATYATVANLPCIFVQRYNREVVQKFLLRRVGQSGNVARPESFIPPEIPPPGAGFDNIQLGADSQ